MMIIMMMAPHGDQWRTSYQGITMPFAEQRYGQHAVICTAGPLALNVEDLTLILR